MSLKKGLKMIIDICMRNQFRPLTYNQLATALGEKPNTIIQRIQRAREYFDIDETKKPFKIMLKRVEPIIFYRDKNQCHVCRRTYNPNLLRSRYKDPNLPDNWQNIITCCVECYEKDITKSVAKKSHPSKETKRVIWEYHEIRIRRVDPTQGFVPSMIINTYMVGPERGQNRMHPVLQDMFGSQQAESYYEFDELNGKGWFHLTDEGEITSRSLADILDYFGYDGWELVTFNPILTQTSTIMWPQTQPSSGSEEYHCVFKRIRKTS